VERHPGTVSQTVPPVVMCSTSMRCDRRTPTTYPFLADPRLSTDPRYAHAQTWPMVAAGVRGPMRDRGTQPTPIFD
jgi:hypothetical protein